MFENICERDKIVKYQFPNILLATKSEQHHFGELGVLFCGVKGINATIYIYREVIPL